MQLYNSTPHASTGYSPHYLLFGQECRLPVDVLLGVDDESVADDWWVPQHHHRLREAHERAYAQMDQHADQRKLRHDRQARPLILAVGDHVYMRKHGMRGRNKMQDAWLAAPYRVRDRAGRRPGRCPLREPGRFEAVRARQRAAGSGACRAASTAAATTECRGERRRVADQCSAPLHGAASTRRTASARRAASTTNRAAACSVSFVEVRFRAVFFGVVVGVVLFLRVVVRGRRATNAAEESAQSGGLPF